MFTEGLKLMVLGMGWVFVFLALMVVVMNFTAKVLSPFAHLLEPKAPPPKRNNKPRTGDSERQLLAAAVAAVHRHRGGAR